jgi:phospholipase C
VIRARAGRALATLLASVFAIAGCSQGRSSSSALPPLGPGPSVSLIVHNPIEHVVVMIQENRSFDNFFATFPGADGTTWGLMKNPKGRELHIHLIKASLDQDSLGHEHLSFRKEFDHGKMDGFDRVDRTLRHGVKVPAGKYPYRYTDPADIQPYWEIAHQYVLGDHMFSTQSSSSFTAHQDLIAGGTPIGDEGDNVIDFPTPPKWGCTAPPGTVTSLITPHGRYLYDRGPFPCFTYPTLRDLLDAKGLPWLYFTNTSGGYVWNAFDAIKAVREGPEWKTNVITPDSEIFNAIKNGQLPAVSWLIPDYVDSDHPGSPSDTGPSWIASVINAIGESPYWKSTVVIVVWDEWGGQYDHVPPPQLDGQGLGPRVPMLLVSAYARRTGRRTGYVSHTRYEFGSILKFIEDRWNLGRLGTSDVRANSLIDCLDFRKAARAFTPIQSKYPQSYFEHRPPSGLPVDDN